MIWVSNARLESLGCQYLSVSHHHVSAKGLIGIGLPACRRGTWCCVVTDNASDVLSVRENIGFPTVLNAEVSKVKTDEAAIRTGGGFVYARNHFNGQAKQMIDSLSEQEATDLTSMWSFSTRGTQKMKSVQKLYQKMAAIEHAKRITLIADSGTDAIDLDDPDGLLSSTMIGTRRLLGPLPRTPKLVIDTFADLHQLPLTSFASAFWRWRLYRDDSPKFQAEL